MSTGGKKELMTRATAKETRDRIEAERAKACSSLADASMGIDKLIMHTPESESKDAGLIQAEVLSVRSGIADFEQGHYIDARELSRKIRTRHDLCG